MSRFEQYQAKYQHARLERRDGILQVTFHTAGKEMIWQPGPHTEYGELFTDIARDPDNKVVIMTGTGKSFCAEIDAGSFGRTTAQNWNRIIFEGKHPPTGLARYRSPDHRRGQRAGICPRRDGRAE